MGIKIVAGDQSCDIIYMQVDASSPQQQLVITRVGNDQLRGSTLAFDELDQRHPIA